MPRTIPLRHFVESYVSWHPGPRLNIKTIFPRYGDSYVKDKTVGETVLSLTWELPYPVRPSFLLRRPPGDQYESGILFGRTIFLYFVTSTFRYYLHCAYLTKYRYLCFNTKETIYCTGRIFQCCESYFHTPKSRWGFSPGLNYTSGCKTSNEWPIIIFSINIILSYGYRSLMISWQHPVTIATFPNNNCYTSNGSWRQGIKGEMTCTVYVALVWNIIYWIMMIITLFTE